MPNWTSDQQKAITTRGGKVIVSAAAGSGKTAVLSQRVIEYVLSGKNIDELLIVTFTNAAAFEMKTRIKEKIEEEYKKDITNVHLKKQISLVDVTKITTMDAYYKELVMNNFDKLSIDRNFDILSNEKEIILKENVLDEIIEESFKTKKDYEKILDVFSDDSNDLIKGTIKTVSNFLDTLAFPLDFINETLEKYSENNNFYRDLLINQLKEKIHSFGMLYDEISEELIKDIVFEKVHNILLEDKKIIDSFNDIKDLNDLSILLNNISFLRLTAPKGYTEDENYIKFKNIRAELKKVLTKEYLELYFINEEKYNEEKKYSYEILKILFDIVLSFKEKLLLEKRKINSYSFSDIAHFVIELLIENKKRTSIAKEESEKYKEILIDEYQDTNNLQNIIFNAISNDEENLFIVGDVKQSIYRFRSACPEIFNNDKNNSSFDSFPRLITLSKNFRSRKEVLDFCNFIFTNTMTNSFGEVNYDENEMLYLGANFPEDKSLENEVYIIDKNSSINNLEEEKDEDDLTSVQKEAIFVADKIKEILDSKQKIFDNKKGCYREVKASDIVILLRSLKNSEYYLEALNKRNISVYSKTSHEYFDNYEISLIISILKIIDNHYDDVALMSLINSGVLDIPLDLIVDIRSLDKSKYLYENLKSSNEPSIINLIEKIECLSLYSKNESIYGLLNKIYEEFNIIKFIGSLKEGKLRCKNLMHMLSYAVEFEYKSIHEFIIYLESIVLNKCSLEGINPLSEGVNVLITTIHQSKGLEYPIVFLSETGRKFNLNDIKKDIMISDDLKIAFNIKDENYKLKYTSIPMMVFKNYELSKALSEELRILYVALTRAKEKIIITGFVDNLEKKIDSISSKIGDEKTISNLYLSSCKSYLDIIMPCLLRHKKYNKLKDYSNINVKTFDYETKFKVDIIPALNINEAEFNIKEDKILDFDINWYNEVNNFKYDYSYSNVPKSISVSELKHKNNYLRKPNFLTDGISHASIGTLYHKVLEKLPVKKYDINILKEELKILCNNNVILNNEVKLLDINKIFNYLSSDIYDIMLSSDSIKREMKITFNVPVSYYDKNISDGNILVDGVIDLVFVSDDTYYIVDYKTDNISKIEELKELYKIQLDLYEYALKQKGINKIKKYLYSIKLGEFIEV